MCSINMAFDDSVINPAIQESLPRGSLVTTEALFAFQNDESPKLDLWNLHEYGESYNNSFPVKSDEDLVKLVHMQAPTTQESSTQPSTLFKDTSWVS